VTIALYYAVQLEWKIFMGIKPQDLGPIQWGGMGEGVEAMGGIRGEGLEGGQAGGSTGGRG
jgi:hypothetical protein